MISLSLLGLLLGLILGWWFCNIRHDLRKARRAFELDEMVRRINSWPTSYTLMELVSEDEPESEPESEDVDWRQWEQQMGDWGWGMS